jgi:hypothetical protein
MKFPDLPGIVAAILLAPVLVLAPGYFWSRLADVRPANTLERASWSLALSLATAPVFGYNFFLLCPYNAWTIRAFALLGSAAPAVLCRWFRAKAAACGRLQTGRLWLLPALMAALALTCVMDLERGVLLYRGYPAGDYPKHIFVTDAIHRTGVPPVNPVFHPGRPLPLFYYFFWHLVCSMVDGLSGWRLGPRAAVEGMTAWAAAALFAMVVVLASRFLRPVTRRTVVVCWVLLFSTGLDLIGFLLFSYLEIEPGQIRWRTSGVFPGAVDSWNWDGQVTSWMETAMWAPHHLTAAVVSMTAVALVFGLRPVERPLIRGMRVILLAAAVASSVGLSIWVALVFCAFWLLWGLYLAWRQSWQKLQPLVQASVLAIVFTAPLIHTLSHARLDKRPPLVLAVRAFSFWDLYARKMPAGLKKSFLDAVWLGPAYILEFGIFLVGGLWWWKYRRRPMREPELALALLAGTSILLTSFVRSGIRYNDFGWRGTLPAQFVVLLWTAWMLERLWRRRRFPPVAAACLGLGLLTSGYDWAWMRGHGIAMDIAYHNGFYGRHAWALQRLYQQIAASTPADTIVQANPDIWLEPYEAFSANRQTVVLDRVHGSLFGTQGPLFDRTLQEVSAIFQGHASAEEIEAAARKYNIGVIVIQDTDPAWRSHAWEDRSRFRLLARCDYGRAYQLAVSRPP